jgi:hypothetical protein
MATAADNFLDQLLEEVNDDNASALREADKDISRRAYTIR